MCRDPTNLRGGDGRSRGMVMGGVWETDECEMAMGVMGNSSGHVT